MRIKLTCPDGWSYIGWQRVIIEADHEIALEIRDKVNSELECPEPVHVGYSGKDPICTTLFVLSGESFTLSDFAEAVREATGLDVYCDEGD